jgi:hypothetical protein
MATDYNDALRNPQVDYERGDLSPRGILLFLLGLFIAGVFVELVIWGMFHFLARSEALFPQGTVSPMQSAQHRAVPENQPGAIMQNTPNVNLSVFPEPRLQTEDWQEMQKYQKSEQDLLNPPQPFTDGNGAVHIPISLAMQLIAQRGLPTRPSSPPPPEIGGPTAGGGLPQGAAQKP